jgi:CHAT domain-containing protein
MRRALAALVAAGLAVGASGGWAQTAVPDPIPPAITLATAARGKAASADWAGAVRDNLAALSLLGLDPLASGPAPSPANPPPLNTPGSLIAALLFDLGGFLNRDQRLAEAERALSQALDWTQRSFGAEGREAALANRDYAATLFARGRYPAALAAQNSALTIYQRLDPGGIDRYAVESAIGQTLQQLGQPAAAVAHLRTALAGFEAAVGRSPTEILTHMTNLVDALADATDMAAATALLERAAEWATRFDGPDGALGRQISYSRAVLLTKQGQLGAATEQLDSLLEYARASNQSDAPWAVNALYYKGYVLITRSLFVEAEPVFRESFERYEKRFSARHPIIARVLHNLALVHQALENRKRAEGFYDRAIEIMAGVFGDSSPQVASTRIERALLLTKNGELDRARNEMARVISDLRQSPEPDRRLIGLAIVADALAIQKAGDLTAARSSFESALTELTAARGDDAYELYLALLELGEINLASGDLAASETVLLRVSAILRRDQAETPAKLGRALKLLGDVRLAQDRLDEGLAYFRDATAMLRRRAALSGDGLSSLGESEQRVARELYLGHIDALWLAQARNGPMRAALQAEAFEVGQSAQISSAARAISRMVARSTIRDPELAEASRQRQDLVDQWRSVDAKVNDLLAAAPEQLDRAALATLRLQRDQLATRLEELDRRFQRQFASFSQLTNPSPVSVDRLQALLRPGELFLMMLSDPDGTYVWAIDRDDITMARSKLGARDLSRLVASLRRTLDLGQFQRSRQLPDYQIDDAYELYQGLLEPLNGVLQRSKQIIWVPDGPMQSLPLGVLIDRPVQRLPSSVREYRTLPWLGRRIAISTLPSASSLLALRQIGRPSLGRRAFLGVGNPVLGQGGDGLRNLNIADVFIDGLRINTATLQQMAPLPETQEELESMAQAFGGSPDDLLLALRATEPEIRERTLSDYRVIAFATHALTAGEVSGISEPALVLSPPEIPRPGNTGLLTASTIAGLRLDADWVILSACNTAAPGGGAGADGLSGLAQSFFYSGARSLLVSHWAVASKPTVMLTTGTIGRLTKEPQIGKAEALRQSIEAMLDDDSSDLQHPAFWGPFVLVGDG